MAAKMNAHKLACECATQQDHIEHLRRANCDFGSCDTQLVDLGERVRISGICGHMFHVDCHAKTVDSEEGGQLAAKLMCQICPGVELHQISSGLLAAFQAVYDEALPGGDGTYDLGEIFGDDRLRPFETEGQGLAVLRDTFTALNVPYEEEEEEPVGRTHTRAKSLAAVDLQFDASPQTAEEFAKASLDDPSFSALMAVIESYDSMHGPESSAVNRDYDEIFGDPSLAAIDGALLGSVKVKYVEEQAQLVRDQGADSPDSFTAGLFDTGEDLISLSLSAADQFALRAALTKHTTASGWIDVEAAFEGTVFAEAQPMTVGVIKAKLLEEQGDRPEPPQAVAVRDAPANLDLTRISPEALARVKLGQHFDTFVSLLEANQILGADGVHNLDAVSEGMGGLEINAADLVEVLAAYDKAEKAAREAHFAKSSRKKVVEPPADEDVQTLEEFVNGQLGEGAFLVIQGVLAQHVLADGVHDLDPAFDAVSPSDFSNYSHQALGAVKNRYIDDEAEAREAYMKTQEKAVPDIPPPPAQRGGRFCTPVTMVITAAGVAALAVLLSSMDISALTTITQNVTSDGEG